jgi:hypothetical protein
LTTEANLDKVYVEVKRVRVKADRKWGREAFLDAGEATFGD